ncbi:putative teichuronic acid biosynthesis glycosyltransferase TuaC [Nymphon striatum]|nr:putative teichuronic acid biosynthesis glycosyltransferase TuaC [Nymphon striatum]
MSEHLISNYSFSHGDLRIGDRKNGISAFMRIRNGADFLEPTIRSHINHFDEIVAVYNQCSDATPDILGRLAQEYGPKLRVFHYTDRVFPPGSEDHARTKPDKNANPIKVSDLAKNLRPSITDKVMALVLPKKKFLVARNSGLESISQTCEMKVLQINLCRAVGGSSHHHADLSVGLSELGHEVCVIDRLGTFTPSIANGAVEHRNTKRLRFHIDIYRAIKEFKPDIIHTHQSLGSRIANRLKGSIPTVSTIHGAYKQRSYGASNGIIRVADHQSIGMQGYAGKSVTIWNWLRPTTAYSTEDARNKIGISGHDFVFGFVGRILEDKGIFDLISAFELMSNKSAKLVIVGDGPDLELAQKKAANNPNIIFTGFLDDASAYMSAFNCFVMPSHAEAFPLVLIEALHAGCEILASDTKGAKEMLDALEFTFMIFRTKCATP